MSAHHVQIITPEQARTIRERLEMDGFQIGSAPHALFEAVGQDVRVTFYPKRGKLLIQGQGTDGLMRRLGDMLPNQEEVPGNPDASVEEPTIGSDESGKGDYFGSLVVAGCLVKPDDVSWLRKLGVRDSKDASDTRIRMAEGKILERLPVEVVEYEPMEYGRLHKETGNVNVILGRAHGEVIRRLLERETCGRVVVDRFGSESHVLKPLGSAARGVKIRQIPRAEVNPAVAAASFVARTRFMDSLKRLSDDVGVDLLPGASKQVEERARKVFAVGGRDLLARVAKMHFKTTDRVVS